MFAVFGIGCCCRCWKGATVGDGYDKFYVVLVNVRLAGMLSCMVRIACFVMLLVRRLL